MTKPASKVYSKTWWTVGSSTEVDAGASGLGIAAPLMQNATEGDIHATWDGNIRVVTEEGCEAREPAAPGEYTARFCYATSYNPIDNSDFLIDPICSELAFTLPGDAMVIADLAHE